MSYKLFSVYTSVASTTRETKPYLAGLSVVTGHRAKILWELPVNDRFIAPHWMLRIHSEVYYTAASHSGIARSRVTKQRAAFSIYSWKNTVVRTQLKHQLKIHTHLCVCVCVCRCVCIFNWCFGCVLFWIDTAQTPAQSHGGVRPTWLADTLSHLVCLNNCYIRFQLNLLRVLRVLIW